MSNKPRLKPGPSLPRKASEVEEQLEYPMKGGIATSAIWYWAIRRYEIHGLDHQFTGPSFKKLMFKYSRAVVNKIGKDWSDHKAYIEWYLASVDPFIRNQTNYSAEFMSSSNCLNKRFNEKRDFIDTGKFVKKEEITESVGMRLTSDEKPLNYRIDEGFRARFYKEG